MTSTETTTALAQGNRTTIPSDVERRLRQLERTATGQVDMPAGESEGEVTGLGLTFTPTQVEISMQLPAGGLNLDVKAVGAPTADGFAWRVMNGVPDSDDYKFTYRLS